MAIKYSGGKDSSDMRIPRYVAPQKNETAARAAYAIHFPSPSAGFILGGYHPLRPANGRAKPCRLGPLFHFGHFGDGEIWHEVRNPRSAPTLSVDGSIRTRRCCWSGAPYHPARRRPPAGLFHRRRPPHVSRMPRVVLRSGARPDFGLLPDGQSHTLGGRSRRAALAGGCPAPRPRPLRAVPQRAPESHRPSVAEPLLLVPARPTASLDRSALRRAEPGSGESGGPASWTNLKN